MKEFLKILSRYIIAATIAAPVYSGSMMLDNPIFSWGENHLKTEIVLTSNVTPNGYYFGQNFPNPFNPVTNIYFSIPKSQNIKIILTNILGNEVGIVADGHYSAGRYKAEFDASFLTSGVYFYKLETSDFSETKKMTIIK